MFSWMMIDRYTHFRFLLFFFLLFFSFFSLFYLFYFVISNHSLSLSVSPSLLFFIFFVCVHKRMKKKYRRRNFVNFNIYFRAYQGIHYFEMLLKYYYYYLIYYYMYHLYGYILLLLLAIKLK